MELRSEYPGAICHLMFRGNCRTFSQMTFEEAFDNYSNYVSVTDKNSNCECPVKSK